MTDRADRHLVLEDVSKFYGEVLGVNRVNLSIPPGITSIVGPNGSGKSTLLNLLTGLLRPTRGRVRVLGRPPNEPEALFRQLGYCTQYDAFPRGLTGFQFVEGFLRLHGLEAAEAEALAWEALERVGMTHAAKRPIAAFSKGMRQRVKLAQSIAHRPAVLILDEPLNGLDPMARSEILALFRELAREGLHVVISSHILHEVDMVSDRVVLINNGYVVAEGDIRSVRSEMRRHPMQIVIRCDRPAALAAKALEHDHVVEVQIHDDRQGLMVRTRDADAFYLLLNRIVLDNGLCLETVAPADEDVQSVYAYLIGGQGGTE